MNYVTAIEKADLDEEPQDWELGFTSDGQPTLMTLANAIQVWSLLQIVNPVTVRDVVIAFNVPPVRVEFAVDQHPFMYLGEERSPLEQRTIVHEGS